MIHILLVLSLSGLALCGNLGNEYLPPNGGVISNGISGAVSRSFGQGAANNAYSTVPQFGSTGNGFGSSRPSTLYGAPATPQQFGGQFSSISQYNRPITPGSVYGAPSQHSTSGISSSLPLKPQFKSQALPGTQYGAPSSLYGAPSQRTNFGRSNAVFQQPQFPAPAPRTQYGAPSQHQVAGPASYPSQFGVGRSISTQYGAPQQYQQRPQFVQQTATYRAGPQFGGVSSSHGSSVPSAYRPATTYSGTVQDSNGGYVY